MENASEALIMAFSVIIFVMALSISIFSFGQARATSEIIMQRTDSTYDQTYTEADATMLKNVEIKDVSNDKNVVTRTVGAETIIPTLYRAYKENLIIIFAEGSGTSHFKNGIIDQKKEGEFPSNNAGFTAGLDNNTIDFVKLNIGSENRATEFITYMLHSTNNNNLLQNKFMITDSGTGSQNYKSLLQSKSLYEIISENKFNELVGMYYMEDVEGYTNKEFEGLYNKDNLNEPQISDANKTKRRVITYVLNN